MGMPERGMAHSQGRTEQHFSIKFRIAWCLKLTHYFWKFPFTVSRMYLTMESKNSDNFLLYNIEDNCHLIEI